MVPEHLHVVLLAVLWALVPAIIFVVLIVVSWRAANGRTPPNKTSGFRTPATMRSDQTWVAAHRAALRLTPLYLLATAISWAALLATTLYTSAFLAIMAVGLATAVVVVAVVIYAAYVATKAAKSVGDHPDDRLR